MPTFHRLCDFELSKTKEAIRMHQFIFATWNSGGRSGGLRGNKLLIMTAAQPWLGIWESAVVCMRYTTGR